MAISFNEADYTKDFMKYLSSKYKYSKFEIVGKGRKMGRSWDGSNVMCEINLSNLARGLKDHLNKTVISNGFDIKKSNGLLPSDIINENTFINETCNSIIDNREEVLVSVTQMDYPIKIIEGEEIKPTLNNVYRIPLGDHLYWIGRLAFRENRTVEDVTLRKFKSLCISYWSEKVDNLISNPTSFSDSTSSTIFLDSFGGFEDKANYFESLKALKNNLGNIRVKEAKKSSIFKSDSPAKTKDSPNSKKSIGRAIDL